MLDFADCTGDELSAGRRCCASGFRAKTSSQHCLTAAWSPQCTPKALVWASSFDHSYAVKYTQLGQYALEVAEGNVLEQPYAGW